MIGNKKRLKCIVSILMASVLAFGGSRGSVVLAEEEILVEEAYSETDFPDTSTTNEIVPDESGEVLLTGEPEEDLAGDEMIRPEDGASVENEQTTDDFGDAETLILGIETVEDPGYTSAESCLPDEEAYAVEEETEMISAPDCGEASDAQASRFRTFSRGTYTDSYGDQIEGNSVIIYNGMKNTWLQGQSDTIKCDFNTKYTFVTDGVIVLNDQNKPVAQWDKANSDGYKEVLAQLGYDVQSAFDAFVYDYPEVFWLGHITYSFGISFYTVEDTEQQLIRGTISSITVYGVGEAKDSNGNTYLREKYEGAPGEISEFGNAVDASVKEISSALPENADRWDTVKAIHDYICSTVSYGENEYAHTAAGVFHKAEKVVVCEGYAKAMKILCRRFDIPCALIVGNALKSTGDRENHMWNYVRMEDGKWYLVDPTWDDQTGGIRDTYFLVGGSCPGFNAVISTERENYTSFSVGNLTSFILPELSEGHYCRWQVAGTLPATCVAGEKTLYKCGRRGCSEEKTVEGEALGHDFETEWTIDLEPGCTTDGRKSRHCTRCDAKTDEMAVPAGHVWEKEAQIEATCTTGIQIEYRCSREGCTAVNTEKGEPLGHEFSAQWIIDREATCAQAGEQSHHCMREDCDERSEVTAIPPEDHTWDTGRVTQAASCGTSGIRTYTCTVCGQTKTETIAPLEHEYGEWVTKTSATVLKTGVQIRTCGRCGTIVSKSVPKLKRTIKLNVTKLPLQAGKTTGAVKVIQMTEGDYIKKWKSSNTRVATVSKKGLITGKKAGTATITVTLASGAKASVRLTVQKKPVETTSLTVQGKTTVIKNKKLVLKKGRKETLVTKLTPLTSGDKVTYCVSDKKIVTVSSKGVVKARKTGTATITVKAGKKKVILKITVK